MKKILAKYIFGIYLEKIRTRGKEKKFPTNKQKLFYINSVYKNKWLRKNLEETWVKDWLYYSFF
jgi:hypothetical protein